MQFTRLHLRRTSGAARCLVTMLRRAFIAFAMTTMSKSHQALHTRVHAVVAFLSVVPSCANDNDNNDVNSDLQWWGILFGPSGLKSTAKAVQFHSRESSDRATNLHFKS